MNTTGELRKALADCFIKAQNGELSGDALRGVIGCANQITSSIAVEIKARAQAQKEGNASVSFGDMRICSSDNK